MLMQTTFALESLAPAAQRLYASLLQAASGHPNDELIARMLVSQAWSRGAMPVRLGLSADHFATMMALHFPGALLAPFLTGCEPDPDRAPERDELCALILMHGRGGAREEQWMATILAAGCMGADHLWQDLGLWSRRDLSALIGANFPALAARNDRDMKWKKFFYKQLCNQEGIHTCRAPSCEVCDDFAACFGPE